MNNFKILIVLTLFIFAIILRLWNFSLVGRTNDEIAYVAPGHTFIELVKKGDFTNPIWWNSPDEPPLARYLYGLASQFDFTGYDRNARPIFDYDLTYSRLISVFSSSLAVIIILLLGWEFLSPFVGICAAIIFAMLPFFLGFSQLATLESLIQFFFTISIYLYMKLLKSYSVKKIILLGIIIGFAVSIKPTNIFIIPTILAIYFAYFLLKKNMKKFLSRELTAIIYMASIGIIAFFAIWPMVLFHLDYVFMFTHSIRFSTSLSIPELFFGKLHLVPLWYYPFMFIITTPLLILLLFFAGVRTVFVKKSWIYFAIVIWFSIPFLQSFYNHRQHGVRYIIEIYAPLSLLAAIGFDAIISRLTTDTKRKFIYFIPVIMYLVIILFRITPYYIDYFNILVGGAEGVYKTKSFQLGWWGEGTKDAYNFLENEVPDKATVGIIERNIALVPPSKKLYSIPYTNGNKYDYVVLNYYNIIREGFNDQIIRENYKLIHEVKADGATLVYIYKNKQQ